jgi:NEDD8-activating enzyme E1 regulatory subunit
LVRAGARTNNAEGGEENYDEAVGGVMKTINPYSLGSGVREMFQIPECTNPTKQSANFWVIASAIKEFYGEHEVLPLSGSVPDMKAQSTDYIRLQNIYKSKARQDVLEVSELVRGIEAARENFVNTRAGNRGFLQERCPHQDNAWLLLPVPGSFFHSLSEKSIKKVINNLENEESLMPIWLALSVLDTIASKEPERYSSSSLNDEEEWERLVNNELSSIFGHGAVSEEVVERLQSVAQEIRRSGGGELHNIAALIGGMVAQEAIKVVTRQYVPVDNTCVFDGIISKSEVLKLA